LAGVQAPPADVERAHKDMRCSHVVVVAPVEDVHSSHALPAGLEQYVQQLSARLATDHEAMQALRVVMMRRWQYARFART
jgi:hypothetical protein